MFAYCRNNPVKRKDVTGTSDILYTDGDDDNPLDDLGYPGGGGGGGGTSCSYTGYAYAYNPIDAGYSYHVSFDVAMYSSLYTGGIYQLGYDAFEVYSNPTSTSSTSTSTTPSACFIAGTLVQSEDGAVAIEDIAVGDMVWAWDETTGDVALKEVVETYINQSDELIHIFVNGEEIITTPSHPFYSPVKGWTAAVKLRAGDILVLVNGEYVVVEKVQHEILEAPITVYNFQVEGYHTYYVSDTGVLVHNTCPGRNGKQQRLRELASDDKLSSALRGEIKRDINAIERGQRNTIRVPAGYELSHRNGFPARKGFGYDHSDLKTIAGHRRHHKIFGHNGKY